MEIPPELAAGLATGRSVLPSELDPNATLATIMSCFKLVLKSDMAKPLPARPTKCKPIPALSIRSWPHFRGIIGMPR